MSNKFIYRVNIYIINTSENLCTIDFPLYQLIYSFTGGFNCTKKIESRNLGCAHVTYNTLYITRCFRFVVWDSAFAIYIQKGSFGENMH